MFFTSRVLKHWNPVFCSPIGSHNQVSVVFSVLVSKRCPSGCLMTYCCNPRGWTDSGHSVLSYSDRTGDPPHSLCTGRSLSCPHTGPHSLSLHFCKYSLGPQDVHFVSWVEFWEVSVLVFSTYECTHQIGPFGCEGLAGILGHTGHTLTL